jgi:hypothetical protein
MKLPTLFCRSKIDPAALTASAVAVLAELSKLEGYLDAKGDDRGRVMARKLHDALSIAWTQHAPKLGGEVSTFSGGGAKPPRDQ